MEISVLVMSIDCALSNEMEHKQKIKKSHLCIGLLGIFAKSSGNI
tara:strand:+ start:1884 stop:2018 length:135 start_codon:yes stop_codon:yes gene_type:complete